MKFWGVTPSSPIFWSAHLHKINPAYTPVQMYIMNTTYIGHIMHKLHMKLNHSQSEKINK